MLVIIGGSGMLFGASSELTKNSKEPVLLCGRKKKHYQPILSQHSHARFFSFDFSNAEDYKTLGEFLGQQDAPITLLVWVHSPYYAFLSDILCKLKSDIQQVYLVKGSSSQPVPRELAEDFPLNIIQLGKHPRQDRWLTHEEICRQVLEKMLATGYFTNENIRKKENFMTLLEKIYETRDFLHAKGMTAPEFGLILGSGLGELADEIDNAISLDYADIPNWGRSTVVGHAGKLVYGDLAGRKVIALQGRFHFYEGNPLEVVTFPVRVMKALGCEGVIVTNAAGGISFGPGTLMAISDHINMTGHNPLFGPNLDEFGPRFPDMSDAYTKSWRAIAHRVAEETGVKLDEGVYCGYAGPNYETPAEIRAFKGMGADAVGMSTVPEVIVAAHSGLKVLGISAITNKAAGFQAELNHEEVVEVTQRIKGDFKAFIKAVLAAL